MLTEDVRNKIQEIVENTVPGAYLVDVVLKKAKQKILSIKVDTDEGISLAECAQISRKVGHELEEEKSLSERYLLQVSSPGVGYPLLLHRQYAKNIGRHLSLTLVSGEEIKGTLIAVDEPKIVLGPLPLKIKKGKRPSKKEKEAQAGNQDVLFSNIKEAKVIII